MYQIVIANEAADLAQPFADFVKHDRRLDARENLTAVNYLSTLHRQLVERLTTTAVKA